MLSKVGAMESKDATEDLTAALNSYKLSAKDAMGVVDKLNALDLKYATSASEIATALKYTASEASIAGVSLNKLTSLITIASSTTRLKNCA